MGMLAGLTVKPLAIALAIAGALLLASNLAWWGHVGSLRAEVAKAEGTRDTAIMSRDAWKTRAGELTAANAAYDSEFAKLAGELKSAQAEHARLQREHATALAAAQEAEADADRTLRTFMDRYAAQLRAPDCAGALATVQRLCPALEGY